MPDWRRKRLRGAVGLVRRRVLAANQWDRDLVLVTWAKKCARACVWAGGYRLDEAGVRVVCRVRQKKEEGGVCYLLARKGFGWGETDY